MADKTGMKDLWTPRSVDGTRDIYADWADTYDADLTRMSYATPARIAQALIDLNIPKIAPILDFGCGTGLSGLALAEAGFTQVDGTDISPEMMAHAREKTHNKTPVYRSLTQGTAGQVAIEPGTYAAMVATGVISLGAAPPDLLEVLVRALSHGGLLAFSYNDPTLDDPTYQHALAMIQRTELAVVVFREHGPHLSEKVTGSDVIVLRRI